MLKQTLTFEDFDGNEVTEDHYFHLSKAELIDMALEEGDDTDMAAKLTAIATSGNSKIIMATFKDILSRSYGQRDPVNPQKFFKSPEIAAEFMQSLAFDALFTKLLTDANFAAEFVNGIVPKDLRETAEVRQAVTDIPLPPHPMAIKKTTSGQLVPPDPNQLDTGAGTWPRVTPDEAALAETTHLAHPYDAEGQFVPWAFREPTDRELKGMNAQQLQEAYRRKSSGWAPRDPAPAEQ